jgi:cyclopropane-fatty-acyl-phospholipid synthase
VAVNWLRRNTRTGSKRNIADHYDLSNDFFAAMLDPTMTYSSGVFLTSTSTLAEASAEKYDRICRKLLLTPNDHVLEIGTGWGGFALHAAKHYGCQVTTTTISQEQHAFAATRIREALLEDRITLLSDDYRDLHGHYDKLVSIEMIEAVGEKFLPEYFSKCSELLKPEGMMLLQAITIPDFRYDRYRKSVDFIQRYVFPGGFLPSIGAIGDGISRSTDFRFFHAEDFGSHYARTLFLWRRNFWENIDKVRSLGFDERFIRTWHYYLCYCEAGFRERQIGVSQLLLAKPACRREPLLWEV